MSSIGEQITDLPLKENLSTLLGEADAAVTFSLSFAQQRLWFLAQLEPDNPSYNLPQGFRFKGALDIDALEQTISTIIARHESLRTTFKVVNGQPVQTISSKYDFKLPLTNLEELPEAEREAEARRLASAEARRPFDLSRDYPLRAALVRIADDDHLLFLTVHHIVSDGWSMGILTKELSHIYEALTTNQPIELPELPIQYGDFAEWQREWLQGEVLEEQLRYWLDNLSGAPAELKLQTDHPRLAQQSFAGESVALKLSPKLSRSLSELSQREGATLFMTTLAAFQTLLFRYTGQEDIVVGSPIAGRNRVEIESLIGFFVNTLPLRTNVAGNPTFRELLGRVKETALGGYAHQDLPFEKLVEELNPERVVSRPPIFQVVFGLQNVPRETLTASGVTITRVPMPSGTAKFDLTLLVSDTSDGLFCRLEYNTDLFEKHTVERMLGHYETLLEGIVENPDERVSTLPLLTVAERQQLVEWNDTTTAYPHESIAQLFEVQVERNPNAIAVVFEDEQLTYAQLNVRANQLAHHLRKRGVGPGAFVGICVERSPAMVVGILGILKAGGAYVPLDSTYPKDRLAFMLEDTQAPVLLTQQSLQQGLPEYEGDVVYLDADWPEIARENDQNPFSEPTDESLAYVIYTSGSTGRPKGVAVPHRAVKRLVFNTNYVDLQPSDRVALASNSSFDAATFELWGALLHGARLVGITRDVALSPQHFAAQIRDEKISTMFLTTALFNQLAGEVPGIFSSVRNLLFGGEAVDPKWVREVLRNGPPERLLHVYGPTENTTFSTWYLVEEVPEEATTVPIGRAISNTQIYVLDKHLQLVPIGVPGQLYIGGDGLAHSYLKRPELTAERFVSNPFSNNPGARLYKTGDLVRYLPDGNLEFLSRIDHQVKLRGFRIELGEIEAALREHAAVQDAVVMVRDSAERNKILVGYVVVNSSDSAQQDDKLAPELKSFLKNKLPDYMVPGYFVFLETLPLTPGGKVDRQALPAADGIRRQLEEVNVPPRDDLERRLARVWEKLLGVQSVGIRDNFFDLGGHSLLAVQLVSEIQKEVGQRLPLVSLFQGATIEDLARILRNDVRSLSWPTLIEIQSGGSKAPLFCVSTPNVNALGYRSLARYLGPDQPVYGLQGQHSEDLEADFSHAAVDRIATQYLEELRAVRPRGPYQFVGLCRGAHIAYEIARRLEQEGEEVGFLGILDTWVVENTYSAFFHLEYYAGRLVWFARLGFSEQVSFVKKKARAALNFGDEKSSFDLGKQRLHELYFPGPNFVPRTYKGRITVFRVQKQPRHRIRDLQLGWGKLAGKGVDLHFIPGDHATVLKEPHVQGLAAEMKKCLL